MTDSEAGGKLETIEGIVKSAQDKSINPFALTGVQPYIIRALTEDQLRKFLERQRRTIATFAHSDLQQSSSEPVNPVLTEFFIQASTAIDELLKDRFYFRQKLRQYQTTDIVDTLQSANYGLRSEATRLRDSLETTSRDFQRTLGELTVKTQALERATESNKRLEQRLFQASNYQEEAERLRIRISVMEASRREYASSLRDRLNGKFDKLRDSLNLKTRRRVNFLRITYNNLRERYDLFALHRLKLRTYEANLASIDDAVSGLHFGSSLNIEYVPVDMGDTEMQNTLISLARLSVYKEKVNTPKEIEEANRQKLIAFYRDSQGTDRQVADITKKVEVAGGYFSDEISIGGGTYSTESRVVGSITFYGLRKNGFLNMRRWKVPEYFKDFVDIAGSPPLIKQVARVNDICAPYICPGTLTLVQDIIHIGDKKTRIAYRFILPLAVDKAA